MCIYIHIYKSDAPFQVADSCAESHVLISSSYFIVKWCIVYTPQVVIEKKDNDGSMDGMGSHIFR